MNFSEFNKRYPDEDSCLQHLMDAQVHACRCGSEKWYRVKGRMAYVCHCGRQFSPVARTIFRGSRVPLRSWFFVMFLFCNSKNGVSAREIMKQIGVTEKTAWRMGMRIRTLMREEIEFTGTIEADETGIGGVRRKWKGERKEDRKDIVFGITERGGKTMMRVVEERDLRTLVKHFKGVQPNTTFYSDGLLAYSKIASAMKLNHEALDHGHFEWSRGDVHTNTIEAHWQHLKSFLWGTHKGVTRKYLQYYLDERCHAANHAEGRMDLLLQRASVVS